MQQLHLFDNKTMNGSIYGARKYYHEAREALERSREAAFRVYFYEHIFLSVHVYSKLSLLVERTVE